MKKILITGATGFIGKHLVDALQNSEYESRILLRKAPAEKQSFSSNIQVVSGDLLNRTSIQKACEDIDAVVHLASTAHVNTRDNSLLQRVIVEGTSNIAGAAVDNGIKRIIYLSSSLAASRNTAGEFTTAYGEYKFDAEQLLKNVCDSNPLELVVLRPVNVYGPGMKGNIAKMIGLINSNRLPPLPELSARISLVGVEDVVHAIKLALTTDYVNSAPVTLTDGHEYNISEIERAIYAGLGKEFPPFRTPRMILFAAALAADLVSRTGLSDSAVGLRTYRNITTDNLFDNKLAVSKLGWEPSSTLFQELPEIIENILQKSELKPELKQ